MKPAVIPRASAPTPAEIIAREIQIQVRAGIPYDEALEFARKVAQKPRQQ